MSPDMQVQPEHILCRKPRKDKIAAGLLAFFLGGFGVHKFYLNKTGQGITILLCNLLLCWTVIVPLVIGVINLIDSIKFFTMSQETFDAMYNY